jgi:homospermidine synthase
VVPHIEVLTMADKLLTRTDPRDPNRFLYRPTVEHVYQPCPSAAIALSKKIKIDPNHILGGSSVVGHESIGIIIKRYDTETQKNERWWYGNCTDMQHVKDVLGTEVVDIAHANATLLPVAVGALTALEYVIQNPNQGIIVPEDIDHQHILTTAQKILKPNSLQKIP